MRLKIYQVDAFTNKVFSGNPAAVCPLADWLPETLLQKIAMENNLPETAFYVKQEDLYQIRWFTPAVEVDLCGHATLATAFVLYQYEGHSGEEISFDSPRSGRLGVRRNGELITLNFPADSFQPVELSPVLTTGFNIRPLAAFKGKTDYMLVFEKEEQIRSLQPDFQKLAAVDARGIIVTAKGDQADFVSRFFAPRTGINEDPVTGSAHTTLAPYWTKELRKQELSAIQLSARTGYLQCRHMGDRVEISGRAVAYMVGEIEVE